MFRLTLRLDEGWGRYWFGINRCAGKPSNERTLKAFRCFWPQLDADTYNGG